MAILKILISGILIWLTTELGKRSGKMGGLILSLPVTSIIALCWLWFDTKDAAKVSAVSLETLIFILPSFVFFIVLSFMLTRAFSFSLSFCSSVACTVIAYGIFFKIRSA